MIDLGPAGAQDHVSPGMRAQVNAFDLLLTALELANGGRQLRLDLGATIPGLASTTAWLAVGARPASSPWLTVATSETPVLRTAQTRLYLNASIAPSGALAALGIASISLPLYTELAAAQAKLQSIACAPGGASVTLLVAPSIGHASLANVDPAALTNFGASPVESAAAIVRAPLITVSGQARSDIGGGSWQQVSFSPSDIASATVHGVSTQNSARTLAASLSQSVSLNVSVAGLGLNASSIASLLGTQLQTVAPALDGVVNGLTDLAGVHLGEADTSVGGARCGVPALVM